MATEDVEARLAALEAAVARLREPTDSDSREGPAAPANERFWVLHGLEDRASDGAVVYAGSVETPTGNVLRWQYGLPAPEVFAEDWEEIAPTLAALGSPVRLAILHAVLHGVDSAARLVEEVDAGTSGQVYHHLKELTSAGWLTSPKRGRFTVPASRVVPLLAIVVAAGTPIT